MNVIDGICTDPIQSVKCYAKWDEINGRHATNDLRLSEILTILTNKQLHLTANVNNGRHFVAIHGWKKDNSDVLAARDSSGLVAREWFSYKEDIVGWRIYNMTGPKDFFAKLVENKQEMVQTKEFQEYPNLQELARELGLY
eukprot:UN04567